MKVPVYRSQTGLPERTGAGQLSVQASPSALGAVGAAQFGTGQTVQPEGLRWAEHFQKTDHALALTEETRKMRNKITSITDLANQEPVDAWRDKRGNQAGYHLKEQFVRAQLDRAMRDSLSAISSRTVQLSMIRHWQQAVTNARTSIGAILRGRYAPFVKGQLIRHGDNMAKEIALMPDGDSKENAITGALEDAAKFFYLFPNIGDDYWAKYVQNFNGNIAETAVRSTVGEKKTADQAVDMLRQLRSPRIGDPHYKDITSRMNPLNRQRLIENVSRLATRLQNKEFRDGIRTKNQEHTDKVRHQRTRFEYKSSIIARIREAAVKGKDIKLKMPTVMEINDLDITKIQRDSLLAQLTAEKEIYNAPLVAKLRTQIFNAITEGDLETIREDIHKYRTDNIIGGLAYTRLTDTLKGASGKTPEHAEIKRYQDAIKRIMKPKNIIVLGGGYAPQQAKSQAATVASGVAMQSYQQEIVAGVMPAEAFYNTIEKFYEDRDLMVSTQIKTVPSRFLPLKVIKNHKLLTPEHVENAMRRLRDEASVFATDIAGKELLELKPEERGALQRAGLLDKSKRMSVRLLLEYEATLEYLKDYVDIKAEASMSDEWDWIEQLGGGWVDIPADGGGGEVKKTFLQKIIKLLRGK